MHRPPATTPRTAAELERLRLEAARKHPGLIKPKPVKFSQAYGCLDVLAAGLVLTLLITLFLLIPPQVVVAGGLAPALATTTPCEYWQAWAIDRGASTEVIAAISEAAELEQFPAEVLTAQAFHESKFIEDERGDSGRSRGMMQIQSCWDDDYKKWTDETFDPDNPAQAARCAALILKYYGWAGSEESQLKALASYNGSKSINSYARTVHALATELQSTTAGGNGGE